MKKKKVKQKNHFLLQANDKAIINYLMSSEKYKVIFSFSVVLALYGGFVIPIAIPNFWDAIPIIYSYFAFLIFFFAIIFINHWMICSTLQRDFSFYIMRLENKTEYVRFLIRISVWMYLIQFFIILLFVLMALCLTKFGNFESYPFSFGIGSYEISNFVYLLFYLCKFLLFGAMIIVLMTLCFINFRKVILLILEAVFLIIFVAQITPMFYSHISVNLWSIFIGGFYSSFSLDIASALLLLLILEIVIFVLYRFTIRNQKVEIS